MRTGVKLRGEIQEGPKHVRLRNSQQTACNCQTGSSHTTGAAAATDAAAASRAAFSSAAFDSATKTSTYESTCGKHKTRA